MEDIVGLLHRRSDALTVSFAAVDLANLPPVSFDSLDVCALLAMVDSTKAEMDLMKQAASTMSDAVTAQASVCEDLRMAIAGIVRMRSPNSTCMSTEGASRVKGASTVMGASTVKKVCDQPEVGTSKLLPIGPPTDLDVYETASIVISDSGMALFTDVVKRGKKRTQKTNARIAPPAVAVVRKTGKSSAITGRGVSIGIEAAKRSGRLASVFASRLAPELTDAVLKSYLDSKLGLSVNVECVKVVVAYWKVKTPCHAHGECIN